MRQRPLFPVALAAAILSVPGLSLPLAAETVPADIQWKIRREAIEGSEILRSLHMLTDVYGPRLTGSPNLKAAAEWAVKQLETWGLRNGRLEPWNWGHPGWTNEHFSAHIVSPVRDALVGEVPAWTPSTSGPVTASAVQIAPPVRTSREELAAYLDAVAEKVKGRIVLVGEHESLGVSFTGGDRRLDDREARARFDPVNPAPSPYANRGRTGTPPGQLTSSQRNQQIDAFLVRAGAVARVNDAARAHGQIRAFANSTYDVTKAVPTVVLRNEDYGRISRLLASGRDVQLELDIRNETHEDGRTAYNAIAEIPGTDKAGEVVMLGAHLDSWHAATGATDNAIGSAIVMEAARILAAIGVQPRRTIRLALWSGEEQGLLGSKAYVAQHFGTFENPKPEYGSFAGYVNIDTGTGRVRGLAVFGPEEAAAALREATAPLADLGVAGVVATDSRRATATDHTSFNAAGLPGIGTALDPIEYQSHTWHTNLDTYERIIESDAQQSAIVIATVVYHLAMREAQLPRFAKEKMPKPPASDRTN